jgi:hypothetical protein
MGHSIASGTSIRASFGRLCRALVVGALGFLGAVGALGALGACSDDEASEPPPPPPSVFGYETVAEFPRQACEPGSLASLSTTAVYHAQATSGDGLVFPVTFRVRPAATGAALTGQLSGDEVDKVEQTGDDVLLRQVTPTSMRAVHWCGRNATGDLVGTYVSCSDRGCLVAPMQGRAVLPLVEAPAKNLTLLGNTSTARWGDRPFAVNVRVAGGIAYVARYGNGLGIVDVRDPAAMIHLAELPVENPPSEIYNDVKLVDGPNDKRYALMASNVNGVVVVDVTLPQAPRIVGRFGATPADPAPNVHTLAIDGTRAYLANPRTGLDIFDIADPLLPARLGQFTHPAGKGYLHDLYVAGGRAYLNWWEAGMAIVDVTDPTSPQLLGNFENYGERTSHSSWVMQLGARKIALHGDEQYGAHLNVVDVTEGSPTFAKSIASWMTRPEVSIHNVMAMGNLAVIAYYQDGVRVLDLSDPEHPSPVAWFNTWPGPAGPHAGRLFFEAATGVDVDLATRIIYVADVERGLLALRLASGI